MLSKENLLDADESTRAVVGGVAVEQAAVTELVAMAIAGLLRDDVRNFGRRPVGALEQGSGMEVGRRHQRRKRFCRLGGLVIRRDTRFRGPGLGNHEGRRRLYGHGTLWLDRRRSALACPVKRQGCAGRHRDDDCISELVASLNLLWHL